MSLEISPHMILIIILHEVILIFSCTHYCSSGLQSNSVSMKLLVALNALQEPMLSPNILLPLDHFEIIRTIIQDCLSHELSLVAFAPTSLPWVFFSLVVGHLDLIVNQSRLHVCRFDSYLEYWDFFCPAACVNGWKIIFLLYSSGSKFTISSLLSKWVYLNYFFRCVQKSSAPWKIYSCLFDLCIKLFASCK